MQVQLLLLVSSSVSIGSAAGTGPDVSCTMPTGSAAGNSWDVSCTMSSEESDTILIMDQTADDSLSLLQLGASMRHSGGMSEGGPDVTADKTKARLTLTSRGFMPGQLAILGGLFICMLILACMSYCGLQVPTKPSVPSSPFTIFIYSVIAFSAPVFLVTVAWDGAHTGPILFPSSNAYYSAPWSYPPVYAIVILLCFRGLYQSIWPREIGRSEDVLSGMGAESSEDLACISSSFWILGFLFSSIIYVYCGVFHKSNKGLIQCSWLACNSLVYGGTLHLWYSYRCRGFTAAFVPFLLQVLVAPFIVPDRVPFSFQPMGCPNWLSMASLLVSCAWMLCLYGSPDMTLRISRSYDQVDSLLPSFPMTWLQMLCPLLSLVYLYQTDLYNEVAEGIYHTVWTYLPPVYCTLFGVYWLKRRPEFELPQLFACGAGVSYFGVFAPLASTVYDIHTGRPNACYLGPDSIRHDYTLVAQEFHNGVEALLFFVSMGLFYFHGFYGNWHQESPKFAAVMAIVGLVSYGILFWESLDEAHNNWLWYRPVFPWLIWTVPYCCVLFGALFQYVSNVQDLQVLSIVTPPSNSL